MKKKTVVLGVTASIAAYKACDIINCMRQEGIDICVCMSHDAERFISALTLQTLSGSRVYRDMFETPADRDPLHVSIAGRADLVLVAPATAHIISQVAAGLCDDLLSCLIASTKAPVLFAPAMNENMYNNRILQANIERLRQLGYHFIGPIKGHLACGVSGIGHIATTAAIITKAKTLLR